MDRRNFIALSVHLSLLSSAGFLASCGGSGGDGADVKTTTTRGKVVLPSGVLAGASVVNGYGNSSLSTDGGFGLATLAEVPSIAMVLDASGKLALFGYVDPDNPTNTLDAEAAAVALLFLAIGGSQASINDKKALLTALRAEAALGPLAATIATRLTADPLAIHNADPTIQNALVAARNQVQAAHVSGTAWSPGGQLMRAMALAPRLAIEQSGEHSGVEVLQDPARDGVILPVNHHRRWCKVFHYRVGYEDTSGASHYLTAAEALNNGDALDAVTPVGGVFTTLSELMSGTSAWVPVNGKPFSPAMKDDDVKAYIETVVLGSAFASTEPAFFGAPRYASHVALWRASRERLNMISWMADIFFGLLLEVLGVRGAVADLAAYEAAATAWEQIDNIALKNIIAKAQSGQIPRAMLEIVQLGLQEGEGLVIVRELAAKSARLVAHVAGEKAVLGEALWLTGFKALGGLMLAGPGIVMGAVDLGAVVKELNDANQADLWNTTLIKPTVAISPANAQLGAGQEMNLTVSVPGAANGATFSYQWTLSGSNLASLRGDNKSGSNIETTSAAVALTTTPSTQGTLTITVKAYQLGEGGSKTLVGDARSLITMSDASTAVNLFLEDYATTPPYSTMAAFLVFPLPMQPASKYRITVVSTLGMYGSNSQQVYEISAQAIAQAGPEMAHLLDQEEIPVSHISGNRTGGWWFFKRGSNLYLYFDSFQHYESGGGMVILGNVFDGPRTIEGMQAEMHRRANSFTVLYEQIP